MFLILTLVVAVLGICFGAALISNYRNSVYTYLSPAAYDEKIRQLEEAKAKKIETATFQSEIDDAETLFNVAVKKYKIRREHG